LANQSTTLRIGGGLRKQKSFARADGWFAVATSDVSP
jgi:hypothetical protein